MRPKGSQSTEFGQVGKRIAGTGSAHMATVTAANQLTWQRYGRKLVTA
jgi:hypothetical protein